METGQVTIGEYLINKLYEHGLRHAFGIPGDYVLAFYKQLYESKINLINTCDEQSAGYAANAYARVRGLGVVCITYGVGALEGGQHHRPGLCRRIPGGRHQRRARHQANSSAIPCCTTRPRTSTPSSRSSRSLPLPRPCWTTPKPPAGRSTACWQPPSATGARSISKSRATWSR